MSIDPVVFVIDDDAPGRDAACALVRDWGVRAVALSSADEFAHQYRDEHGCVVANLGSGAVTVLDKPPAADDLRQAIGEALAVDAERRARRDKLGDLRRRLATLSDKERFVLEMIVAGRPNKAMANQLGSSLRTVENRRREVFMKLGVRSVAELVTLKLKAEAAGADF
jgi:FixJ family two-component response regulator